MLPEEQNSNGGGGQTQCHIFGHLQTTLVCFLLGGGGSGKNDHKFRFLGNVELN